MSLFPARPSPGGACPAVAGGVTGNVSVVSDATNSSATISLLGGQPTTRDRWWLDRPIASCRALSEQVQTFCDRSGPLFTLEASYLRLLYDPVSAFSDRNMTLVAPKRAE